MTLNNGVGFFVVTLKTAGNQTVVATDTTTSSITGTATVNVIAGAASHFAVTAPSTTPAGSAFVFTVTAEDAFNNAASSYSGTVHFTSSDTQVSAGNGLPLDTAITNGTGNFAAILKTAGNQTISSTDTTTSIAGTSNPITVTAGTATHFAVSGPGSATAGSGFSVTVTAEDQFNNTTANYTGTVHFASGDGQAVLPGNSPLVGGTGAFSVTLKTAGTQSISAIDTVTASIAGNTTVNVSAIGATHFQVSAPANVAAGSPFVVVVTAVDPFNNTATSYSGIVHFTSTDPQVSAGNGLPSNAALSNGTGSFAAILKTAGNQTIAATDTATSSITGNSNTIAVSASTATHFLVSAPGTATAGSAFNVTVTAEDQFNNTAASYSGTVHFTSSDGQAILPANSPLAGGTGTFNVTLKTAGNQTVAGTDTVSSSTTGSSHGCCQLGRGKSLRGQRSGDGDLGYCLRFHGHGRRPVQQHDPWLQRHRSLRQQRQPVHVARQRPVDKRHWYLHRHAQVGGHAIAQRHRHGHREHHRQQLWSVSRPMPPPPTLW